MKNINMQLQHKIGKIFLPIFLFKLLFKIKGSTKKYYLLFHYASIVIGFKNLAN